MRSVWWWATRVERYPADMLVWLLFLVAASFASPVTASPARRCAEAVSGTEVEVCLSLVAEHPDEVDAVARALRAHMDRAEAGDRNLLGAVLQILGSEEPERGAVRLGELDDPRAVGALEQAGETGDTELAVAAAAALASHPGGLSPLSRWVVDRKKPVEVRVQAAISLGALDDFEASDALLSALRRPTTPPRVRAAAMAAIRTGYPSRLNEVGGPVIMGGEFWMAAGSAWGLGYPLAAVGHFSRAEIAIPGGAAGAVAGGTGGYVIARAFPMSAGDAAMVTVGGIGGTAAGMLLGSAVVRRDRLSGAWGGGLAGEALGFAVAGGLVSRWDGTQKDTMEATMLGTAAGVGLGMGFNALFPPGYWEDRPFHVPELAAGLGIVTGLAIGHAVAPRVSLDVKDWGAIGLASAFGAIVGGLVPVRHGPAIFESGPDVQLVVAGAHLGLLVGFGLSTRFEANGPSVLGGFGGLGAGSAIGVGVGLLINAKDSRVVQGAALGGATVGTALGTWLGYRSPRRIDNRDLMMVGLGTGWATWQAVGWGLWADVKPPWSGFLVMAPPITGALFAITSDFIDVPIASGISATSIGLLGGYAGGAMGQVIGEEPLLGGLVGSNVGLIVGTVILSPSVGGRPLPVAMADVGGILGGSLAALGASMATDQSDPILISSLAGLGAGVTIGAIVGVVIDRRGVAKDLAFRVPKIPGKWALSPTVLPGRDEPAFGARVQVTDW